MEFFSYHLLIISSILHICEACLPLGCLGLGLGCLPSPQCLLGPCLRTPQINLCPCNSGYQCVSGGCVMMARARGAKTYQDGARKKELTEVQEPNEHFLTCCKLLDVPFSCHPMCSYEGYNKTSIQSSLLLSTVCPIQHLPQVHFCAARGSDHKPCCAEAGLPQQCDAFCDQRPSQTSQLNFTHMQCFERIDDIRGCFVEHALTEYYEMKQKQSDANYLNAIDDRKRLN